MDGVHVTTGTAHARRRQAGRRLVTAVLAALLVSAGLVLTASPAGADVTPGSGTLTGSVGTVAGTVNSVTGGTVTFDNTVPGTTTLTVSGARTVIDLASFSLAATDRLHVVVTDSEDIVLLRVATGAATVQGRLHATLGAAGDYAGNVWLLGPAGIDIAATAQVEAGGFLGVAGTITDADALDGDLTFAFSTTGLFTGINVAASSTTTGAVVRGHGGLVGFVAPRVSTALGTQIGAAPGSRSEVLIGSARNASLALGSRGTGLDLLAFTPSGANQFGSVVLAGTLTAADVFVSSLINPTTTDTTNTYTTGVVANGFPANGDGDVVVAGGGGLARSSISDPVRPVLSHTAPAQIVATLGTVRADRDLVISGSGQVELSYGTDLAAQTVAISARGTVRNLEGAPAVNSALTGKWVVYAPRPEDVLHPTAHLVGYGTLNSGQRAVWGGSLESRPPSSLTGNRYVFSNPPDILVEGDDTSKDFDTAFADGQPAALTATVTAPPLHPGVPDVFLGDSGTIVTGEPAVASEGQPHTAPERPGGYPIVPSIGSLSSPLGYEFVFLNGTLTVDDTSPPTVTPNLTGTVGDNGWYRGNVGLNWSIVDPGTISSSITGDAGCATRTITADQDETVYTCTGTSLGGTADPVSVSIKRDASAPVLTIDGLLADGGEYTAGSWTNQDVEVFYTCAGAISGVASQTVNRSGDNRFTESGDADGECTDNAGNSTSEQFRVNIDKIAPTVHGETFTFVETGATYTPGTWANQPVRYAWRCSDGGDSGLLNGGAAGPTSTSLTFRGYCADHAGNSTYGAPFEILIDSADPTIVDPTLTSGGNPYTPGDWATGPVTLSWDCADTGGSDPAEATGEVTATASGTLTAICTDGAGNEVRQSFDVTIDDEAPVIGDVTLETADGGAYTSGDWTNQAVTLSWTCTDGTGQSGATEATGELTATSTGGLRAICTDVAGNSVQGEQFQANIDGTDPTIIEPRLTSGGSAYTPGNWARGPVTLIWGCEDQGGSLPDRMGGEETATASGTLTATCTDRAGNDITQPFEVLIDGEAPAIGEVVLETADGAAYSSGAWTAQAVTLSWTCTDGTGQSGATEATGEQTATSTGGLRPICTDLAGNTVQGELFQANVDDTDPVLSGVPADQSLTTDGETATATWATPTATDDQDTSPDVVCTPASGSSFDVGTTTVTCTATDHAGNTDTGTFTVTVSRNAPTGVTFRAPIDAPPVINVAARNRMLPVRISVPDLAPPAVNGTTPLYTGTPERIACPRGSRSDAVETYTSRWTVPSNLFYWDARKGNWLAKVSTWGLVRGACYRVPVSYGGTIDGQTASGGTEIGFFHLRVR